MPGARGIEKIEIRSGEAAKHAHEAVEAKTAPFIRPVVAEGELGRALPSQSREGLKDFLAIGERAPEKSLELYSEALRDRTRESSAPSEPKTDSLAELPLSTWRNFYRYLETAVTFLLGGLAGGMGAPMMIFGSFIFLGKDFKVSSAEEYKAGLNKYNDALREFDDATLKKQSGQSLSVEQQALLINPRTLDLHKERSRFVRENEHRFASDRIVIDIDIDRPTAPAEKSAVSRLKKGELVDGRYRIIRKLGTGGMGIVYLCEHEFINKQFAIKVMRPEIVTNEEAVQRFLLEAKAASAIGHPNIIEVKDAGRLANGSIYLTMEFLEGQPLDKLLEGQQAVPEARLVPIARQIAAGLAAAHRAGIIHRDLKPENIFLIEKEGQKDFVKILDFGIAKMMKTGGKRLTQAGMTMGTPEYMPPERAVGGETDLRGDVYSFGIILYELASGKLPFYSEDIRSLLIQHVQKAPTPLREDPALAQSLSPALESIILKAIAKKPSERYQSMEEMIADLDRLPHGSQALTTSESAGETPKPSPTELTEAVTAPRRVWPWIGGFGAAAGLTALFAAFLATRESKPEAPRRRTPEDAAVKDAAPTLTVTPIPPDAMPAPIKKKIEIKLEPRDAHVFQGGRDLGAGRVFIEVEAGVTLDLEVRRKGFKTLKLGLDDSQITRSFRLEREKTPKRPPPQDKNPPVDPKNKERDKNQLRDPFKR